MAICTEGRFEIDSFHTNTTDKAIANGRFYSDKAPGTVCLALIGAAPAIWFGKALGLTINDEELWLLASWTGCAVLNVVLAAGFVALSRLLMALLTSDRAEQNVVKDRPDAFRAALATALFTVFGGMAWPYATILFSHAQSIGCTAMGLWFLHRADPKVFSLSSVSEFPSPRKQIDWSLYLAGFAFGWSLNSEYTTGIIVLGVPMLFFAASHSHRSWVPFLCGLALPCLLIPLYSWVTIGVPWQLPYSYQASFPEMKKGLYAIHWPDLEILSRLLFSPERGMVFWSPFIVVSILGYIDLYSRSQRVFLITYGLPLLHIVVISGRTWDWPAGPTFSARYLAPIVPLLAIPCALGLRNRPRLAVFLGMLSILMTGIATVTDATPAFNLHHNPLLTLNLPLLYAFNFNPNLVSAVFGASPTLGVIVFLLSSPLLLWWLPNRSQPNQSM